MKKLCESSLGKIEIANGEMDKKWYEKIGEGVKNTVYSVGATTSGFVNSVVNNVAGTDLSNLYLFEGYEKAYYGGAIGGDIASGIIGLAETIVGPIMAGMGILTTGGGILVSSTGIGTAPGMAVSGVGVAITTVGVAATGQGVGIIGNSGNNLSDHIQNFKDSGTSNNNKKYTTNKNGYYGEKGQSDSNKVRNMNGGLDEAKNFFDYVTDGYKSEKALGDGKILRTMEDGTNITFRPTSSSDGTPVVDIHNGSTFVEQKIHFIN